MRERVDSGSDVGEGVLTREVDATAGSAPSPSNAQTGFVREGGSLHSDGVSLETLAADVGTPAYVYSAPAIRSQYARLSGALD